MKIIFGCGRDYKEGYVNLDHPEKKEQGVKADIYWDLEIYPYPFKDNSAEEIVMINVLDHLSNNKKTIEECHRILKPKGRLKIRVPHHNSPLAHNDMTHVHTFDPSIFDTLYLNNVVYPVTKVDNKFNLISKKLNPSKYWGEHLPQRLLGFLSLFIGNLVDTFDVELEKKEEKKE